MKVKGDARQFWAAVDEAHSILRRLNYDGSFIGFGLLFSRLLEELPANFIEAELIPATHTGEEDGSLLIGPGPDMEALVTTLRALDVVHYRGLSASGA